MFMKSSELIGKKVIIAPFCQEAVFIYHQLMKQGVEVIAFMDINTNLHIKRYLNIPVIPYFYISNTVVIVSNTVTVNPNSIEKNLLAVGYESFIRQSNIDFNIPFREIAPLIDVEAFINMKGNEYAIPIKREIARLFAPEWQRFNIRFVSIDVTNKCTLNCRYCCVLMPYQKPYAQRNFNTNVMIKAIDKLIDCVDFIPEMSIIGGEPFLNENLKNLLLDLNQDKYKRKVGSFLISTNGTVVPDLETIEAIKKLGNNIYLYISSYKGLSKRIYNLLEMCNKFKIKCIACTNLFWTNMCQPFDPDIAGYSFLEAQKNCSKCNFVLNNQFRIVEEKLYKCMFLAYGEQGKIIPEDKRNYLDLINEEFSSDILRKYLNDFQPGMVYCSTPVTSEIERGEGNILPIAEQVSSIPEYAKYK